MAGVGADDFKFWLTQLCGTAIKSCHFFIFILLLYHRPMSLDKEGRVKNKHTLDTLILASKKFHTFEFIR